MRTLYALLLFQGLLLAQQPDITSGPTTFTGVSNGTPIFVGAGGTSGVPYWRLTYFVDGTGITAAQVAIQGADAANAAGCSIASFATITTANANLVESVNPAVSGSSGNVAVKAYYPCIRASVTAITGSGGTVTVTLFGYKGGCCTFPVTATFTPSGTQDVNLVQVGGTSVVTGGINGSQGVGGVAAAGATTNLGNPQQAAGIGPDGAIRRFSSDTLGSMYQFSACNLSAEVALSGTNYTTIITGSGSNVIRLCKLFVTSSSGGNPTVTTFTVGFGTCSGTPTEKMVAAGITGLDLDFGGSMRGAAGESFCVKEAASQSDKVTVTYAQTVY